jgi:hypothetical protein
MEMPVAKALCLVALAGSLACTARLSLAQHAGHPPAPATRWSFLADASLTLMYVNEGTKRGDSQFAAIDWELLSASRWFGGGQSLYLSMTTTLTPFTMGWKGLPQLLQTGGTYRHAWVHDRMHSPAAIMSAGIQYRATWSPGYAVTVSLAPVGSPTLGPTAFMHRETARRDPLSPLGHHWQDATHQSFGVAAVQVQLDNVSFAGSAFNAREADENHRVVDFRGARLDSYAGSAAVQLSEWLAISAWTGFLNEPHRLDPTTRMHRMGASIEGTANFESGASWTTMGVWGMNVHHHGAGSHHFLHAGPGGSPHHESRSALLESSIGFGRGHSLFVRAEAVEKSGEELGFLGGDLTVLYPIQSLVLGGTRHVAVVRKIELQVGARASLEFLPEELRATYGTRRPSGFALFMRLAQSRAVVPE